MRAVTYGAACSLDGFITGPGGSLDWLHFSRDVEDAMTRYWSTVDTVLMGRKTWEFAAQQGAEDGTGPQWNGDGSSPATYVFSRTLHKAPPGVELISSDPGAFVNGLKRKPGKGICVMGGGELANTLFAAGAIDEVSLNVHPVLLGSGVPFFRPLARRIPLELAEARTISGGCVLMTYRVQG